MEKNTVKRLSDFERGYNSITGSPYNGMEDRVISLEIRTRDEGNLLGGVGYIEKIWYQYFDNDITTLHGELISKNIMQRGFYRRSHERLDISIIIKIDDNQSHEMFLQDVVFNYNPKGKILPNQKISFTAKTMTPWRKI